VGNVSARLLGSELTMSRPRQRTHDLEGIVHMSRSNDDDVVEEKVARLEVVEESQEAMGEIVHPQRVLIAGESLVVFAFGTIAEADQDLGLTM